MLVLTSLTLLQRGLDFASVHDSYWTHAGTMEDMNESIREQVTALDSTLDKRPGAACVYVYVYMIGICLYGDNNNIVYPFH